MRFPTITFPGESAASLDRKAVLAAQHVAKYGSIVVLDTFSSAKCYTPGKLEDELSDWEITGFLEVHAWVERPMKDSGVQWRRTGRYVWLRGRSSGGT